MKSWTRLSFQRCAVALAAVALGCGLPLLTGCTNRDGNGAATGASSKAALVERGISADRLNTAGYGASVPRETNATLAGRARNRRVELTRQ